MDVMLLLLYLLLFSVIVGVAVAFLLEFIGILSFAVPYLPTKRRLVEFLTKEIHLDEGNSLYDLGAGDGRVVRAFARAYPKAKIIGVELAPLPLILYSVYSIFSKPSNAHVLVSDFNTVHLRGATHVYCYLLPKTMEALAEKFDRELEKGAMVYSCEFAIPEKTALKTSQFKIGLRTYTIYTYVY